MNIIIKTPNECTDNELSEFEKLILEGNEVISEGLSGISGSEWNLGVSSNIPTSFRNIRTSHMRSASQLVISSHLCALRMQFDPQRIRHFQDRSKARVALSR